MGLLKRTEICGNVSTSRLGSSEEASLNFENLKKQDPATGAPSSGSGSKTERNSPSLTNRGYRIVLRSLDHSKSGHQSIACAAAGAPSPIDSAMTGGMGAPEAASFATAEAAEGFADSHGGTIVRLADIPDDYVLGAVDTDHRDMPEMNHGDMVHEP